MILFLLYVDAIYFTSHPLACFHLQSLALDIHPCNFHHPQSFLGTVENMFDEELLEKEKVRAIEAKKLSLTKENKLYFVVFCRDHSNGENLEIGRGFTIFQRFGGV